ncbi:uncharacterized protein LOC144667199 [Oculina patagonica]
MLFEVNNKLLILSSVLWQEIVRSPRRDNCEIIDNCTSSPCQNSGTCSRHPGGYNCTCPADFYGDNCEIIDNCTSSPCRNNGTCTRIPGGYSCMCWLEFYGDNCQIRNSSTTTPTTQTASSKEREESVLLKVQNLDIKKEVSTVTSVFFNCCGGSARTLLSTEGFIYLFVCGSDKKVFSKDKVHILPGYPKQLTVDPFVALLAFYLQFPQGLSDNIVRKEVVKAILESDVSSIEESMINGTIVSVQPLVSTTDPTKKSDEESKPTTAIIIGACVGGVLLLVIIIALVLACKRSRSNGSIKQSSKKSVYVTSYDNDAYVSNTYHITSEGQVTEIKTLSFKPYQVK